MAGLYMKELMLRHAGDRILVVTPANLRPQWARELAERFDMSFTQLESGNFDAHPGENPWDVYDYVIVSRDFLKSERVIEAFANAERRWDLAVIDEAHGYTISVDGKGFIKNRSERYKAGEFVAKAADRLILLTATPHSGRDASLWALLRLLDIEAVGDRMPDHVDVAPERYRKVSKENMKDMAGNDLFKPRHPQTVEYELVGPEWELYEAVTDFVSRQLQEIRGENSKSAAGFALTTMQRRLASSVRAIRRTLERRMERIERALEDPEEYLRKRAAFKAAVIPDLDTIEDLDEDDLWKLEEKALEEWLPDTIAELELEREALGPLLTRAQEVEALKTEKKLTELLDVVRREGLADDQRKKLLIFTEHKDTLDYLVEHLQGDFEVAQIHGRLKLGERIAQERYFREQAQIMVATEAAGEGINLQFCHLMVNYDIPWNPNRLEQRMGRIHRIGQTEDVYVFNLVASNTRGLRAGHDPAQDGEHGQGARRPGLRRDRQVVRRVPPARAARSGTRRRQDQGTGRRRVRWRRRRSRDVPPCRGAARTSARQDRHRLAGACANKPSAPRSGAFRRHTSSGSSSTQSSSPAAPPNVGSTLARSVSRVRPTCSSPRAALRESFDASRPSTNA